ncbi:hypothetical protein [Paraburkholderia sp. BCC1885]|uniref:hypothetical protein n=1 Tax=Paraburkholderia sp. BCC1885 TaxID=2562669 RepID=UPI0021B1FCB3|nr:hypothetical protein [Paraburkholderia sp. BCC1885]
MMGDAPNAYGMVSMVAPNEPAVLQTLLQAQFNDLGVTVRSGATGGTASSLQNELDGMDGGGQAEPARMIQSGARIAIQAHTLNDNLGGETVDQYAAYLGQWIQDARASGIRPVLEEAAPTCDTDHPRLPIYVSAMDAVAKQYNVPVIAQYAYVQSIPDWQTHMLNCLIPDAYLDALKAKQELTVIAPLVEAVIGE